MGCQKSIAETITSHGSDYLLQVKENQPKLHAALKSAFFDTTDREFSRYFDHPSQMNNVGHGREELRRCWVSKTIDFIPMAHEWAKLSRIVVIELERKIGDKESLDHRFYITSDLGRSAEQMLSATRAHWGIESMHWMLDVAFHEDMSLAINA